ncbi:hypothetical protein COY51_01285 [Candidatus Desantisbacteria bacterium CG_4_10_14_0_8_um_filter_39_17]|nr:MAG: hypothetical protein COY51_01285 [Candidatus Desantisbacteria bacterium CG_4_10_14_0_8_um_filter_39_17]
MSLLFSLLILQVQSYECWGQSGTAVNPPPQPLSAEDANLILKKGKNLFDSAHYEEASREFLVVAQSNDAPQEDRIKARYFLMKIYRAYGEDEKVKNEIIEILKLNPNYTPSSREPASVRKLFKEVKEEFLKGQSAKESGIRPEAGVLQSMLMEDMATLERSLAQASSYQESFSLKVGKMEKEFKKLKLSFYTTSLTLFLLLAVGIGFK